MKIWAYVAIVIAVLGGAKWAHSNAYKSGFNAAIVEQEKLIADEIEKAEAKKDAEWQGLVDAAEGQIITEEVIVERVRVVNRDIPVEVEKIVTVRPECNDLGAGFVRVWNSQVRSGADNEMEGAGLTP